MDIDEMRRVAASPLIVRAQRFAQEMRRSADAFRAEAPEMTDLIEGNDLMAEAFEELATALGDQARMTERLGVAARFLHDQLTMSNEEVDALYGRSDCLEQAAVELREALNAWSASR